MYEWRSDEIESFIGAADAPRWVVYRLSGMKIDAFIKTSPVLTTLRIDPDFEMYPIEKQTKLPDGRVAGMYRECMFSSLGVTR